MVDYSSLSNDIISAVSNDTAVQEAVNNLRTKARAGAATYADATALAEPMTRVIANILSGLDLTNVDLCSFAEEVIKPVYTVCQKSMIRAAVTAQENINALYDLFLNPLEPETDESRIEHIIERFRQADDPDEVSFLLGDDVLENIFRSSVTDVIRENAEYQYKSGVESLVTRSDGSGCCDWCASVVGSYSVDKVPSDFWRVHKGCSCVFDYRAGKTRTKVSYRTGSDGKIRKVTEPAD